MEGRRQSRPSWQASHRGHTLGMTQQFTYFGSILTPGCDPNKEIQQRINLASSAFGWFASRVFFNHDPTVPTKVAVYKAICISFLLYGSESWIPYRWHIRMLEAFQIRCLQSILGIRWWHNSQHWVHWASIAAETTPLARPRHPYALKPASSSPTVWTAHWTETSTSSKVALLRPQQVSSTEVWHPWSRSRAACSWQGFVEVNMCYRSGLESFAAASDQAASDRRARRYAAAQAVRVESACPQCGSVCASDFGLCCRLRVHQRPQWQYHYSARHRRHRRTTTSKQAIATVMQEKQL